MCAWDKSYHSLAYPKVIISPQDMPSDERSFYSSLVDTLKGKIEIEFYSPEELERLIDLLQSLG